MNKIHVYSDKTFYSPYGSHFLVVDDFEIPEADINEMIFNREL